MGFLQKCSLVPILSLFGTRKIGTVQHFCWFSAKNVVLSRFFLGRIRKNVVLSQFFVAFGHPEASQVPNDCLVHFRCLGLVFLWDSTTFCSKLSYCANFVLQNEKKPLFSPNLCGFWSHRFLKILVLTLQPSCSVGSIFGDNTAFFLVFLQKCCAVPIFSWLGTTGAPPLSSQGGTHTRVRA